MVGRYNWQTNVCKLASSVQLPIFVLQRNTQTHEFQFQIKKPNKFTGGIGAIMYELATLSETPLNISQPFLPPGKPTAPAGGPFIAKGNSYGKNLDAYPYTDNFKITIWECLYENKEHRVTVLDLKRRAIQVMAAFETKGGKVDDYADLIPPEPKSALMVPDVPVLVACLCVAKLRAGQRKGRKCGRKAYPMTKKDINAGLARCLHHPIGAWPEVGK